MNENEIKLCLREKIFSVLSSVPGVVSVTLVGSFMDRKDLLGISDIDIIVICDQLNREVFYQCLSKAQNISPVDCGLNGYRLKINSSFGPLKFDEPELVVLHLMVYDLEGHRKHVLASPFTCLDWERNDTFVGKQLGQIFPVGCLQPRDFLEARRGLDNYLKDLRLGAISIRDYEFGRNNVKEVRRSHPLDARHRGEYAYHIVRNLILNGLKLKYGENRLYLQNELEKEIEEVLDGKNPEHAYNFRHLTLLKEKRSRVYPEWTLRWVMEFVTDFQETFSRRWQSTQTVFFIRHARTPLNDGSFLGRVRDPCILSCEMIPHPGLNIKTVYSSPARRCLETVRKLAPELQPITDERLHEINYGTAEGWTYEELHEQHPDIIQAWTEGEDQRFPGGGENSTDVLIRLQSFIKELEEKKDEGTVMVVTHNVVLRCLIGDAHTIPRKDWHRLNIPHSEPLEFKLLEGRLYANIPRTKLGEIFKSLGAD